MFKKILDKLQPAPSASDALDYARLPIMSGEALIDYLGQQNRIRAIRLKVMIDSARFEQLYLKPIYRFAELAQLAPASQSYHHAHAGGLVMHTLTVIEYALNERQKYVLPLMSEPDVIESEKHLWTYGVFVAAICHDAGKLLTMTKFLDAKTGAEFHPLNRNDTTHYRIAFRPNRYFRYHEKLGMLFMRELLDGNALAFLSRNLDMLNEVVSYINADKYEAGSIGKIVSHADQMSVAKALKIANQSRKFPGANTENFGERIMRTLRLILNNNKMKANVPGATFWITDTHTYAVAKNFAEAVREEMKAHGATDVPSDNSRIFDEVQQHGFAELNPDSGQAIFRVHIQSDNCDYRFTCIKIINHRLYAYGKLPSTFEGTITELTEADTAPIETETLPKAEKTTPVPPEAVKAAPVKQAAAKTEQEPTEAVSEPNKETKVTETDDLTDSILDDMFTSEAESETADESSPAAPVSVLADEIPEVVEKADKPKADKIDKSRDKEIVSAFFDFIQKKIETKEYIVNRNSPVFIVNKNDKKHLAIMTPIAFADFAKAYGLIDDIDSFSAKAKAAELVQKPMHHEKINVPIAGKQVHYFKKLNSPAPAPKLSFYIFEPEKIPNEALQKFILDTPVFENLQEFYKNV